MLVVEPAASDLLLTELAALDLLLLVELAALDLLLVELPASDLLVVDCLATETSEGAFRVDTRDDPDLLDISDREEDTTECVLLPGRCQLPDLPAADDLVEDLIDNTCDGAFSPDTRGLP